MFTGDNASPALWMFLPGAVSLEMWLTGVSKIKIYPSKNDVMKEKTVKVWYRTGNVRD